MTNVYNFHETIPGLDEWLQELDDLAGDELDPAEDYAAQHPWEHETIQHNEGANWVR